MGGVAGGRVPLVVPSILAGPARRVLTLGARDCSLGALRVLLTVPVVSACFLPGVRRRPLLG
ncbi:hypothetical protein ALMP_14700 [Streptomyces sp. A012304]|nr:hypothetical protein ALMP_14700 [Streptomyces sp. A012304]